MIRVLLVSQYPLFTQGLQSLLHAEADLLIVGEATTPNRVQMGVRDLQPDVVILGNGSGAPDLASEVMGLFRAGRVNSVVELDLQLNTLHLYHREDRTAQQLQDLTRAIRAALPRVERQPE